MKKPNWGWIALLVFLCLAMTGLAALSFTYARTHINRGLDIAGGISILLEAVDDNGRDVTDDAIDRAIAIIQNRIDELGVVEPVVQKQGENRVRVELPGLEDEKTARELIGRTAMLNFVGPDGEEVILTGENLRDASAIRDPYTMEPVVTLEFDATGRTLFAEATGKYLGQPIMIYLDDERLSAPVVQDVIRDGSAVISGIGNMEDAGYLALMLRSGALPVALQELEFRMVGPTLGERTEEIGIWAAAVGMLAVLLFLIIYYRLTGVIAAFSLVFYLGGVLMVLTGLGATLTLPGIAGLILSIGMAVDANVIIFERIREELRNGKTMLVSLENGFERAFSTIMDANVTTIIVAVVLFSLATGPVRGFAVTLFTGIICSMIVALIINRFLLRLAHKGQVMQGVFAVGVKSS